MCSGILIDCYRRLGLIGALFLLLLAAPQCAAQLSLVNGWVKLAPPAASVNAAYVELKNEQSFPQTIVDVSADCCAQAMLHKTKLVNGMASMEHLTQLVVPAQQSLQLVPGGLHIMLMEAHSELVEGTPVTLTLSFSNGTTQKLTLIVKPDAE